MGKETRECLMLYLGSSKRHTTGQNRAHQTSLLCPRKNTFKNGQNMRKRGQGKTKRRRKQGEENRIRELQRRQQEDEMLHGRVDVPEGWQPLGPRGNEIEGRSVEHEPLYADHNLHPTSLFVWLKALLNATYSDSKAGRSSV